jgi:spore protease
LGKRSRRESDMGFSPPGGGALRTDLALEAHQAVQHGIGRPIPGVVSEVAETEWGSITRATVSTPQAARALGKSIGTYVTIEAPDLPARDKTLSEEVAEALAGELVAMIIRNFGGADYRTAPNFTTLVCGLGNWNATPDAVGPMVAEKVLVTRHIHSMTPPEKRGGLRAVAALSPGVLGTTGIETAEIIAGVVERLKPDLIIVADALAARSVSRLGTTIQLGDSGIQPGSGVGNRRFGITRDSMGVPVIAVGVPTVVHAMTIVQDALGIMGRAASGAGAPGVAGALNSGPQGDGAGARPVGPGPMGAAVEPGEPPLPQAVQQMLQPYLGSLIVTPKEVDVLSEELAEVVAGGINLALHPAIDEEEIYQYLQ